MREIRFAKTKIIGTIGPASKDKNTLRQLVTEGLDIVRINSAHGSQKQHLEIIRTVRLLEEELNMPITVLYDLAGPKIRLGKLPKKGIHLETGSEIELMEKSEYEEGKPLPVECHRFAEMVKPGQRIFINDGFIQLVISELVDSVVKARVKVGGKLTSHKGVNLPGAKLDLPALSEDDRDNLRFGLMNDVDWFALSFVREANDIDDVLDIMEEHETSRPVIAKIETPQAVGQIDKIIEAFQGCMVARGDLGVEIPIEDVPHVQKEIIAKCNLAGIPVITATQMLESMVNSSRPTRAEAADVANAIYDGTDCVMLSGETAVGKYPMSAVDVMNSIILSTESQIDYKLGRQKYTNTKSIADSVSHGVFQVALDVEAKAIVTMTQSGSTARMVSKYRPPMPIFALTQFKTIQRQLNLVWGVSPLLSSQSVSTDEMFSDAEQKLKKLGVVDQGDRIVLSAGVPIGVPGTTNLLKVLVVE